MTQQEITRSVLLRALYANLDVEWHHCSGRADARRHGVIRGVPSRIRTMVCEAIAYYNGWDAKGNVEFYQNTSVYPPGKKPWSYCGETVLFQDWQDSVDLAQTFEIGEIVRFDFRDEKHVGIVSGINDRLTIVDLNKIGVKYYMPAERVTRTNERSPLPSF